MKYQVPYLLKNGGGNIVIISSAHQQGTRPGGSAYSASKQAINGIVKSAAMDYGTQNIRINSIAPGAIDTPLFRSLNDTEEKVQGTIDKIDALKRIGTAEETAAAAVWLASDDCKYITGTSVLIDGGMLCGL